MKGFFCFVFVLSLVACQFQKPKNWVAKVNGNYITQDDVDNVLKEYPQEAQQQLKSNPSILINQLVNQELLYQEAKVEGIENQEDYIEQINKLEKQLENSKRQLLTNVLINQKVVSSISINSDEIKQFYDQNKSQFDAYEQRNARHILVKTGKEALTVYNKAIAKQDFSKLAKQYSIDPTSDNGGDLGWFRKGQLVPEFEKAVFNLSRKGSISKVVKTSFGYHVIKLEGIKKVPAQTFDESKEQIKKFLYNQKQSVSLQQYIEDIKKEHNVSLNTGDEATQADKEVSQVDSQKK